MSERSGRELAVFAAAMELPVEERSAFVARECAGDALLKKRVEDLLRADSEAGAFLEQPPPDAGLLSENTVGEQPGDRIGRYTLLEQIGEGGCGVVFIAEQTEPVCRKVALKVIKPGMDTKNVIARFEAERQALALMDHPNIAKVFDAGATESGRPYFVMELVSGVRITEYCDHNSLNVEARLQLFIQVCEAIQHAHQKGVIHRDIKPSNVLVREAQPGAARPVVIDFGIAKATIDQSLTDQTALTALEMLIGTPAYMSPEQAAISKADVDTRTDIYSLGVLLYELLTGCTPFDADELLQLGIDEIRRAIREQEPQSPSARLNKMPAETLTGAARHRLADPHRLIRSMRGDLDWIVMKCLEKDCARRYATANGLAADVERHLKNEPVSARPPSLAYRIQKAIRRNKLVFGALGAVALALVAGIVTSTWQMMEATKARNEERLRRIQAQDAEQKAQAQTLAARRTSYSSEMRNVQQALRDNDLGRARLLLDRQKPQPGELDLRDWEWRYLWAQARASDHDVLITGAPWSTRPLSFSANGRMLVREVDGSTVVTDLDSRRAILERANARLPVFSHHGNLLAFVTKAESTSEEIITILDVAAKKESEAVRYGDSTEWIGFTPDDRQIITVSRRPGTRKSDGAPAQVTAWEAATGRQLWQRTIAGRPAWVRWRPYAISPNGAVFAAALPEGKVQVMKTSDGTELFTVKASSELSVCVMFSPDSSTLVSGAGFSDTAIRLWDAANGESKGVLEGHSAYVTDLLFTADGTRLISSSADQTIQHWDWATRRSTGVLCGHLDEVDGIALAPDNRTLASRCKDGSIYLWDVTKPSGRFGYRTLPGRLRLRSSTVQFTPDSRSIVGVESDGTVAVWDIQSLSETRRIFSVPINGQIGLSPDAKWIVTSNRFDQITVWDASSGVEKTTLTFKPPHEGWHDWSFINDGSVLVTVSGPPANALLESWDANTWRRIGSIPLRFQKLLEYSVKFEPRSFSLPNTYVLMADGAFRFFDIATHRMDPRILRSGSEPNDWTGSPDGRMMAAADSSGLVRVWDAATLQVIASLKSFRLGSHSVAFSPDGRRLVAGSNGREAVRIWDVATWKELVTLSGDGSRFGTVKFSPDGRHLLAINDAGLVHVWTAPTLTEIAAHEARHQDDGVPTNYDATKP